jgi:2-aminoadipate transaminase
MTSSMIRELLKLIAEPDIISFAGGLPAPELFPIEEIKEAVETVLTSKGQQALQYSATEGYPPLRDMLVRHMKRYGIVVDIDNVLITSGSQQALDLIGKILINPGDKILTELPTYLGAIQAFTMYGADYITVPIDDNGVIPESLEVGLRAGPKFMYLLPNFQNPTGVTISAARRRELVLLADRYGIPIIEDDPYGQLRYEGEHISRRRGVPRVRAQRQVQRECDLHEHVQQDPRAGAAARLDRRPEGGRPSDCPGQAGHRPAQQHLRSDGRLRGRPRRLH